MGNQNLLKNWSKKAEEVLLNKKIVAVEYMSDEMMQQMGWHKRPIIFQLDDDTICFLSCDDEGNDGGSLFYGTNGVLPTI